MGVYSYEIGFFGLIKAKLQSEKPRFEQPSLHDILDCLLGLCQRLMQFFVIQKLDRLIDLTIQKQSVGLLKELRTLARLDLRQLLSSFFRRGFDLVAFLLQFS